MPSKRRLIRQVAGSIVGLEVLRDQGRWGQKVHRGKIWAISCVRDEEDVIEYVILHLISQGVSHILIADNLSKDKTPVILRNLSKELPLTVVQDRLDAHYHGSKMTILARAAASAGAEWIIPFDADELWYANKETLAEFLKRIKEDVVRAQVWNYYPTPYDNADDLNPFRRIQNREVDATGMFKVAFRSHRYACLGMGNHHVSRPGETTIGLEVAHFPYRNEEQFVRKLINGRSAIEKTNLGQRTSFHKRMGGAFAPKELRLFWRDLVEARDLPFPLWTDRQPLMNYPAWGRRNWLQER